MYKVFIRYCVFFHEYSKVCHLSLARTRLLLVVQNITSQQEWLYSCIALRALKVSYSDVGEGGVAVNCEKTQFFSEHPVHALRVIEKLFIDAYISISHPFARLLIHWHTDSKTIQCEDVRMSRHREHIVQRRIYRSIEPRRSCTSQCYVLCPRILFLSF